MANLKELIFEYCNITGRPTFSITVEEFLMFKNSSEELSKNPRQTVSSKFPTPAKKETASLDFTPSKNEEVKTIDSPQKQCTASTVANNVEDTNERMLKMMQSIPC